jgi:NhaP-type Na+/H+ or K+/H+ antiporter
MFLGLGLIALAYGLARLASASAFLAVLATGLALRRVAEMPSDRSLPLGLAASAAGHGYVSLATHPQHASATMRDSVQLFNGQLEKLAELILVVGVGAMLAHTPLLASVWWFVPAALLIIRPLSVLPVLAGQRLTVAQGGLMAWFGIRGIGSVYYLALVVQSDIDAPTRVTLTSMTLWTVTASIVAHGLTARPLMRRYGI